MLAELVFVVECPLGLHCSECSGPLGVCMSLAESYLLPQLTASFDITTMLYFDDSNYLLSHGSWSAGS